MLPYVAMGSRVKRLLACCGCALACSPRSDPPAGGGNDCGTVDELREPNQMDDGPPVAAIHASRLSDGSVRILLGPIIRRSTNEPVQDLDPAQLTVRFESGPPVAALTVAHVSPEQPAELDVVFLLDTSRAMGWAIDGARLTIAAFAGRLEALGFRPQFGGIEFGDEVRTQTDPGTLADLERWFDALTPHGGGDPPSSALDALERLRSSFTFRRDAARYAVLVTQSGLHELDDGSDCANLSFFAASGFIRGSTFLMAMYPDRGLSGIPPERLTDALGGVAQPIPIGELETWLRPSVVADVLVDMYAITIAADEVPAGASSGSLSYTLDGEELLLGIQLAP